MRTDHAVLTLLSALTVGLGACAAPTGPASGSTTSSISLGDKRQVYDVLIDTRKRGGWCDDAAECTYQMTVVVRGEGGREFQRTCARRSTGNPFPSEVRYADSMPLTNGTPHTLEITIQIDPSNQPPDSRDCVASDGFLQVLSASAPFDVTKTAGIRVETDDAIYNPYRFFAGDHIEQE